jgi:hypothetical protein
LRPWCGKLWHQAGQVLNLDAGFKPNGVFTVIDQIAIGTPAEARKPSRRVGALLDLFFAACSTSGTWSVDDIHAWQRDAGLTPLKTRWTMGFPLGLVSARRVA